MYIPKYSVDKSDNFLVNYKLLTDNMLSTLEFHRNLLISESRLRRGLAFLYFKNKKKELFDRRGNLKGTEEDYAYASSLFIKYIYSLVGFWITFKQAPLQLGCDQCVIIEENRAMFENHVKGSNVCLCCGKDIPEGRHVCKQCEDTPMVRPSSTSDLKRCPKCRSINLMADQSLTGSTTCLNCGFKDKHSSF